MVSRFFSFSLKFISLQRSVSKETSFFHLCFLRLAQLERGTAVVLENLQPFVFIECVIEWVRVLMG